MITAEGIEGAAYVGDYQPVNLYAGAHKVAGWHSQTVSGEGTVSLDGAYNVPPDALVIDGKCVQTGTPSPDAPAPITTITGDLSITGANGDLSDTATIPLGVVELCSLPDGTKDEYDAVTGIVTKRCGKVVFDGSGDELWYDTGAGVSFRWRITVADMVFATSTTQTFICDSYKTLPWASTPEPYGASSSADYGRAHLLVIRNVDVTTLADWTAHLAANPVTVICQLATPYTIQLAPDLPVIRTGIKTLSVSANITPTFTTTVKAMD